MRRQAEEEVLKSNKAHLKVNSRADSILQLDPAIRYVAVIDYSNTIIECKGQGTFQLSLERFRDFSAIGPLLILGSMACKLESCCGRLAHVVGRFENALVTIYQLRSHMVVVITDSTFPVRRLEEISVLLKRIEKNEWKL